MSLSTLAMVRETAATSRAIDRVRVSKATGTSSVYEPKQKEWKDWCKETYGNVITCETVTQEKLIYFLEDQVIGREVKKRGRKRKIIENPTEEEIQDENENLTEEEIQDQNENENSAEEIQDENENENNLEDDDIVEPEQSSVIKVSREKIKLKNM